MFVIGNLIAALASVVSIALNIYMWIMIARVVLSWVNPDPFNPIVRFIHNVTEPILGPIRQKLPLNFGGLDLSPIVVFLLIVFLQRFVVASLQGLAVTLH
ncbi:MAG: YggT family protein [Desulfobacterales bacterium]